MQKRCEIGGQAVMEGVMMRSKERIALAVRDDSGHIVLEVTPSPAPFKPPWSWPILRGMVNFVYALVIGMKTLVRSSEILVCEPADPDEKVRWYERFGFFIIFSVALALVLGILLFFALPAWIISLIGVGIQNAFLYNFIEGLIRIGIFVGYVALCTLVKDVRRTFRYHGAEHQVIACFEKGDTLTVENARKCSPYHPRCGTSFILLVFLVGILVFSFFGKLGSVFERVALRLLLLPLVAGIAYEALKGFAYSDNFLGKMIRAPGLLLQRLTALKPDDDMLEVAICAFEAAAGTCKSIPQKADDLTQAEEMRDDWQGAEGV